MPGQKPCPHCGKAISSNHDSCLECAFISTTLKDLAPEGFQPETTHLITKLPSQEQEILYRVSDGIALGRRSDDTIVFGEELKEMGTRKFINAEYAKRWLRKLASMELVSVRRGQLNLTEYVESDLQPRAVIEEISLEKLIQLAPASALNAIRN
jgi:hypothetical protein